MTERRVSIILATFNCEKTIKNLLKTILSIDWKNFELVITDNGSEDATTQIIEEMMPILKKKCIAKLLKLSKNMGYCYGANTAIDNSSGEFLCLIDHDIEMTPSVFRELIQRLELDGNIGAVQPKVINAYNRRFVDSYDFNEDGSMRGKEASSYTKDRKILYCIGACCMTRRKTYDHIGGLYDDFFLADDVDFGWRLWLYGYSVRAVPTVEIYHSRGTLRGKKQLEFIFEYNGFKNLIAMIIQNLEMKNLITYLARALRIAFFSSFRNPRGALVKGRATFWIAKHLSRIIERRYLIQNSRRICDAELIGMLKHVLPRSMAEIIKQKRALSVHTSHINEPFTGKDSRV